MYYVYVLRLSNGNLYKWYTSDLKRRLSEHHRKSVASTKNYHPFELIHYECYKLQSDAVRREKFLKKSEWLKLLKKQIRDILSNSEM